MSEPRKPDHDEGMDSLLESLADREQERWESRDAQFLARMEGAIRDAPPAKRRGARGVGRSDSTSSRRGRLLKFALPVAAALILLVALPFVYNRMKSPADGFLYHSGDVAWEEVGAALQIKGGPGGAFVYQMGGGNILVYSQEVVEMVVAWPGRVLLSSGEAWFLVQAGSGRFEVETPHGKTLVLGTMFGVKTGVGETHVQVTDGSVLVVGDDEKARLVVAGGAARLRSGQPAATSERAVLSPPDWVWELHGELQDADWKRIYPSRSPHD